MVKNGKFLELYLSIFGGIDYVQTWYVFFRNFFRNFYDITLKNMQAMKLTVYTSILNLKKIIIIT